MNLAVFMGRSSNAVAFCLVLVARLALALVDSSELLARNAQQAASGPARHGIANVLPSGKLTVCY